MSDPAKRAEEIEQRYVGEHEHTEELLEGLDPEQPEEQKTTRNVAGAAPDTKSEDDVDAMSREDP
ncbi:hypothetical protein LQ327_33060 [Actinomycetospora endophytica]|uniref:Autophagy-related protein 2 n=1 Tax=Actinomycetospora endophytica TaxID=2291215 RepID=A0ABS8PJH5_9PSEU|nr:hypothetical protein [Actinomycetospora endophytica]MCD2198208.1 hypothetical protein [Actinomycetospora endophytica]